jgi:hypothetical protein
MARAKSKNRANGGANFGFDATLWAAADKLRGHMEVGHGCHPELTETAAGRLSSDGKSLELANSQRPRGHGRQMKIAIRVDPKALEHAR